MLPTRSQRSRKRSLAPPRARRPEELFFRGSNTPFGKVTADGDVDQPIQWSSEYHDTETALNYYNYRYYNPTDGRWTRRDLIIYDYKNLYIYTYNNINKYVDYNGNELIEITEGSFQDRIATPIMNFLLSLGHLDVPNDYIFGPDTYVAKRFWNMNTPLMDAFREYFEKDMDTYCHQTPLPEEPYYEKRSNIVRAASLQEFFRDVFTLAGIMDEGGRWIDFGIYMGGTFTYSFEAKIDCCTKIKTFDMVIYDEFTLASLTRNPKTRNSLIDSRTIKSTMTIIIKNQEK